MLGVFLLASTLAAQRLNVATVNVWSGLTYKGSTRIGEYESPDHRESRTRILIDQLRSSGADIVALQEANPVHTFANRIADALGYDVVAQRVLGGIKVGPFGIPVNLNEGLAILARKGLDLEFVDVWLLSEGFGAVGNALSFHLSEETIALVARIRVGSASVLVVNTHWPAEIEESDETDQFVRHFADTHQWTDSVREDIRRRISNARDTRMQIAKRLASHLHSLPEHEPVILLGDFNVTDASKEFGILQASGFADAVAHGGASSTMSWDASTNTNCVFSTTPLFPADPWESLHAAYDAKLRRIDHILTNRAFPPSSSSGARRILDLPVDSVFASDHFGIMTTLDLPPSTTTVESESEFFPILSYDTDVGFGYGAKAFLLNSLGSKESFDIVLFNSTKGERWYRLVWSFPDFELRQGMVYPWAIDVTVDYDKYLKNSFFGVGDETKYSDREYYTREPLDVQAAASRGFTRHFVAQAAIRYKMVRNFAFSDTGVLRLYPSPSNGRAAAVSALASVRYDTRNSFINPSRGVVFQGEVEFAPSTGFTNSSFMRGGVWMQAYTTLFYPKTVLAMRGGFQALSGKSVPVQFLLPVGGNQTLRGSPQDRFLDKIALVLNAELRFPIIWRFGGVVGWDAGRVQGSDTSPVATPRLPGSGGWRSNPVAGVRFYMDTFVVRADLGFGSETTGFYLNFGHLF